MSKELVAVEAIEIEKGNLEVVPFGLVAKAFVHKDEWTDAVLKIQKAEGLTQWYLGDLVVIADDQWKGEMYDTMMESTGCERQSLWNIASVCRAYPQSVRQRVYDEVTNHMISGKPSKLGFHHFRMVAPIMNKNPEKAVDFLIRAGKEGWSVNRLIEEIIRWKNNGKLPEEKKEAAEWIAMYKGLASSFVNDGIDYIEIRKYKGNELVGVEEIEIPQLDE